MVRPEGFRPLQQFGDFLLNRWVRFQTEIYQQPIDGVGHFSPTALAAL